MHAAAAKEKEEEMYQQGEAEAGNKKVQKQAADHHEADHQGGEAHQRPEQWSVHGSEGRVHVVPHVHAGR